MYIVSDCPGFFHTKENQFRETENKVIIFLSLSRRARLPETYHRHQQGCVATRQQLQLETRQCSGAERSKEARTLHLAGIERC